MSRYRIKGIILVYVEEVAHIIGMIHNPRWNSFSPSYGRDSAIMYQGGIFFSSRYCSTFFVSFFVMLIDIQVQTSENIL